MSIGTTKPVVRNSFIDFLRGIVIVLMLWGHCIQYMTPATHDFFENEVFQFIYSFHMPLFIIISGYLMGKRYTADTDISKDLGKRVINIGIPLIFGGGILNGLLIWLAQTYQTKAVSLVALAKTAISSIQNLWFLWSVLLAAIIMSLALHMTKRIVFQVLILLCTVPFIFAFPNNMMSLYVIPYYVLSFYYAQIENRFESSNKFKKIQLISKILSIIAFVILLLFYQKKHFIYTTGLFSSEYSTIDNIKIDAFRYLIGLVGSVAMIVVTKWLYKINSKVSVLKRIAIGIEAVGKNSLQVYVLSCSLLSYYLPMIMSSLYEQSTFSEFMSEHIYGTTFSIVLGITIIYTIVLYLIVKLSEKIKVSKFVFGR